MNKDIKIAKKTIQTEIQALKKLSASFNRTSQFSKAVNVISKMKGKCFGMSAFYPGHGKTRAGI